MLIISHWMYASTYFYCMSAPLRRRGSRLDNRLMILSSYLITFSFGCDSRKSRTVVATSVATPYRAPVYFCISDLLRISMCTFCMKIYGMNKWIAVSTNYSTTVDWSHCKVSGHNYFNPIEKIVLLQIKANYWCFRSVVLFYRSCLPKTCSLKKCHEMGTVNWCLQLCYN